MESARNPTITPELVYSVIDHFWCVRFTYIHANSSYEEFEEALRAFLVSQGFVDTKRIRRKQWERLMSAMMRGIRGGW